MGALRCIFLYTIIFAPFICGAENAVINMNDAGISFGGQFSAKIVQIIALITVMSVAPAILVMITSFTRIVVVLSFLRTALGLQQTPPNMVITSLAMFLTLFVMMPTLQEAYDMGFVPLMQQEIDEQEAFIRGVAPFHKFMIENTREKDIELFIEIAKIENVPKVDLPLRIVIPSFIISELKRGFEIGFLIFLPFLIIDMLVASTLMAMGMMMIPPVMISLPFKIIFFVLIDGWYMLCGSLVRSYGV